MISLDFSRRVDEGLQTRMKAHVGRYADKVPDWDAFPGSRGYPELARSQIRYIGAGGSPKVDDPSTLKPEHFTLSMVHQPVGKYGASHAHEVEEAFLVLEGVLTVGWEEGGKIVEQCLGPRDLIFNPAGQLHHFRNEGLTDAQFMMIVGTPQAEDVQFRAA